MKGPAYETVTHGETPNIASGGLGRKLFSFVDPLRWYLLAATVYAAGAIAAAIWILQGPSLNSKEKVLRVSGLPVKQLYSGLALSLLLAPAAIIIRRISYDLALLQPFAIASSNPIRLSHFDAAMNPGIYAATCLLSYSWFSAFTQIFLLITGAALVPVGTLMLTTNHFNAPSERTSVVGMPVLRSDPFASFDDDTDLPTVVNIMDEKGLDQDLFLQLLVNTVIGVVTQQMGKLETVNHTLGPIASANFTYEEGVTYHGVVTYSWTSGCGYTNETVVTITSSPYGASFPRVNGTIDFPDATVAPQSISFPDETMFNKTNSGSGGDSVSQDTFVSYFVLGGVDNHTTNWDKLPVGTRRDDRVWWSSFKCAPTFDWGVSSCTYENDSMGSCIPTPGKNFTVLDELSLNLLPTYFSRLPGIITELDRRLGNRPLLSVPLMSDPNHDTSYNRAPELEDLDKLYGLFAKSIAAMTSAGYLGSAEVSTSGLPSKPVYVARIYIVAVTLFLLILAPALAALDIWLKLNKRLPLRRTTFLTVANAVRGPWWDKLLWGHCTLSPAELRSTSEIADTYVKFGVDEDNLQHIGLAPNVRPVDKDNLYFGITE